MIVSLEEIWQRSDVQTAFFKQGNIDSSPGTTTLSIRANKQ